ncbi:MULTISPECIES: ABC transporter ATP-binding protein [unclassified Streptomyces]|uniref:ABC transporter ATP-binding protein n=1 Tax=unclassified Streptomyces TaxID=2593676 RepID=UPI001C231FFD|nr:ABC transporter ATP-binding protein [Streptomyces sp. AC558_RSS880]
MTSPAPPVVDLAELELVYPVEPPVTAVRSCDLTVRGGEYVAVVGASGSGKSSLLNVIGLLDRPTSGRYRLDGIDTTGLSDAERTELRARRVGFVFQAFHLLPYRTAAENVMLGLMYGGVPRRRRAALAARALERVGMGHRLHAEPTTLSGGERQRVAIARALAVRPSLLLCDEPTGNLDSATARTVLDLIAELHGEGVTVVVITHDASVAAGAGRVVRMRDGVLTEDRTTRMPAT